jgi:hypothetical protein
VTAASSGIATYDDLVQRCQDWLFGRVDIAAQVPTYIQLFEAKANRTLKCRQMETRAIAIVDTTVGAPEFLPLPPLFHTMRRVRIVDGAINGKPSLRFATGQQMSVLRDKLNTPGEPVWFTLFGNEIELYPVPGAPYQIEMVYRATIPPLSPANETNWLLAMAPDAYLYGVMMEAAPYLHDDDRVQMWSAGAQAAITQLNDLSEEALYNAGPLVTRLRGRGYS